MSGSNNFLQFNPTQANQETDAVYASDPQRTGGAVSGVFASILANKLFYQVTTFVYAFAQMLANNGAAVSDSSASTLISLFQNYIALLASPAFTGTPTAPKPSDADRTTKLAVMANFDQVDTLSATLTAFIAGFSSHLAVPGFQELDGGLILQWGSGATTTGNGDSVSFYETFPSGVFVIFCQEDSATGWGSTPQPVVYGTSNPTASGFKVYAARVETTGSVYQGGLGFVWFAIGH